ncbi:FdtA/QdtA family cupin domain-containing protein [Gaetbulibacter aestuarii]
MSIKEVKILEVPKITDVRGNLSIVEEGFLPFEIKRVYYLYDVPSDAYRGGHAHKQQFEFLVALSGSFNVLLSDSKGEKKTYTLYKPNQGLLIPNRVWRELNNFSSGSVCLVIASDVFMESDYIRDPKDFFSTE